MNKVLYIKANNKSEELSRTYRVSEAFIKKYKELNPDDEIITLDLYKENINFLTGDELLKIRSLKPGEGRDNPILKYAYQFAEADKYVIASPLWNLSIPAILKAYIDYVSVAGITFKYTANGAVGLCNGKKAIHIVARGGEYSGEKATFEMGDRYLRTIFGFFGISDFTTIAAEKLDVVGEDVEAIVDDAIKRALEAAIKF